MFAPNAYARPPSKAAPNLALSRPIGYRGSCSVSKPRESGNLGMLARLAAGLARQEITAGDPDTAVELVQLAHTANDALTPNAVSTLQAVKALAYARKSDATGYHRPSGCHGQTRPGALPA